MATETTLEEYKAAVDRQDAEECEACSLDNDACLFHAGVEVGIAAVQRVVAALEDTDLANAIDGLIRRAAGATA